MARARRGSAGRDSRNYGKTSGVTFHTIPSGTTVVNSGVTTPVVSATNINATKVKTTNFDNASSTGYSLPYATASGKKHTSGILSCAGTSLSRQTLGLTTINNVFAVAAFNRSAVSACAIVVVKPNTSAWASGVTHVDLYAFATPQGGAFATAVSIFYQAIGA